MEMVLSFRDVGVFFLKMLKWKVPYKVSIWDVFQQMCVFGQVENFPVKHVESRLRELFQVGFRALRSESQGPTY